MRVIAGAAKGHKLQTIEGLNTRPTTDRIKETLFNIIAFDLPESRFLDLFSGSGAIGIEALSRGADTAGTGGRVSESHCGKSDPHQTHGTGTPDQKRCADGTCTAVGREGNL